jgi:hypothetical protein
MGMRCSPNKLHSDILQVLLDKPMAQWRKKLNKIRPTHHSKAGSRYFILRKAWFSLPLSLSTLPFCFYKRKIVEMHQASNMVTLLLHLSKACKMLWWGWWWCVSLERGLMEIEGSVRETTRKKMFFWSWVIIIVRVIIIIIKGTSQNQ